MLNQALHSKEISEKGFTIIDAVFSNEEVQILIEIIEKVNSSNETFRKSSDIFAIREFLKELPETRKFIFNEKLNQVIHSLFGEDYFVVKSIYFDKPASSNWFVAYHQDITISVDKKVEIENFGPWTKKQNQFSVQPPIGILEKNFTIRFHLDDTDEKNGALKVIPNSHSKGIIRAENELIAKEMNQKGEVDCIVKKGGIMIMKPLLFHSSGRTVNDKKRRVIHIEFSNQLLPEGLSWSEKFCFISK